MLPMGSLFPYGDQNRRGAPVAWVTITLVALNAVVFLYMLTLSPARLESFVYRFGAIPAEIGHGQDLYTLITSQFVHGGLLHIVGNMLFLWVFGDNIELALGHWLFLAFYLGAGVLAALAQVVASLGSSIPAIGASGAIAGILGAYVVLFPTREVRVLIVVVPTRVSAVGFLGAWALLQLFSGVASLGVPAVQGGVAVWAHVGGFAVGLAIGALALRGGRQDRA
ncbi:MAG TPA: rhomboid family intramembrane serine protease [Anaerolineae bacterium]|nr:rhomboid family intramembrane serine protease [Anaerolineae bacterium]HOQ98358.1 rhomboid family intramembrane serine protease [Anaerolineae bacterium]HPL26592.1 rhomboid family intramembrane serine protease [Anaerolineae bacterium]